MQIRIGVESARRAVLAQAHALNAPILVSANSLWDARRQRFSGWQSYAAHDCALDSGGFVAMRRYGAYRWPVKAYVALAGDMRPAWWAQMDFCCEPELAQDRAAVASRVSLTVSHLHECQRIAQGEGVAAPMPVLQGWHPSDYTRGPAFDERFTWPALVGIGSVCRRPLYGPCGLLAVMDALSLAVPSRVQFHLFGVKSAALAHLINRYPGRVASVDSMAYMMACRWDSYHAGVKPSADDRAQSAARWYRAQLASAAAAQALPAQLPLSFTP